VSATQTLRAEDIQQGSLSVAGSESVALAQGLDLPLQQLGNEYFVSLDFFSGPMDLLLHLVEQQEVEIEQVDLSMVCDQYLKVIEHTKEIDLDRAGEFLVVAATLVARKSEALLPRGNPEELTLEDGEVFDPRFFSELRERLIAYKETKIRADLLLSMPQLGIEEFSTKRIFEDPVAIESEHEEIRGEPYELGQFFFNLLKRIGEAGRTFKVKLESITVVKYMVGLLDAISSFTESDQRAPRGFLEVVSRIRDKSSIKGRITGTFIATLELAKRGVITVTGEPENFSLVNSGERPVLEASEFDAEEQNGQAMPATVAGQAYVPLEASPQDVPELSNVIEISKYQEEREVQGRPSAEEVAQEFVEPELVVNRS